MNTLDKQFNKLAKNQRPKYLSPFSLRLTFEERAKLDELAGGQPLGRYIREQLLGEDAAPRKKRGRYPVKDHEALGRVLGALGASCRPTSTNLLMHQIRARFRFRRKRKPTSSKPARL